MDVARQQQLSAARTLRSAASDSNFDYQTNCLICSKAVPTKEERKKHPLRNPVSTVSTLTIQDNLKERAMKRGDACGREVLRHIDAVHDLVAAEARYHRECYQRFTVQPGFLSPTSANQRGGPVGRRKDTPKHDAFLKLCGFLDGNEDCQFTLRELHAEMMKLSPLSEVYDEKYFLSVLKETYGDAMFVTSLPGVPNVLCFKGKAAKVLHKSWYQEQRRTDETEERLRIVETAAEIVRQDICAEAYDTARYPTPAEVADGGQHSVPKTVQTFIEGVVCKGKKGNKEKLLRKCLALEHSLIAHTRPRSFMSPLHFGLAIMLHKFYASRYLIDVLNALGHSISYKETLDFEACAVLRVTTLIDRGGYVQCVFDNVDINVRTLDGHNTLHAMAGIMCVTPQSAVAPPPIISRKGGPVNQEEFRQHAEIPVKFKKPSPSGLLKLAVQLPGEVPGVSSSLESARRLDVLWVASSWLSLEEDSAYPSWSGFMAGATASNKDYETSAVLPTPFVNLQPSNPVTIFTCLSYAADHCRAHQQQSIVVTMDQPLHYKGMDILLSEGPESPLSCIVLRPGGFHMLKSLMGSLGYIMGGTGIENLWETVYAKNTVQMMVPAHAFSRALRAHFLTHAALCHKVLDELPSQCVPRDLLALATSLLKNEISVNEAVENPNVERLLAAFDEALLALFNKSRMGRLWVTYMRGVEVMKLFVRAERSGDWLLHLHSVQEMLPYFSAANHLHYFKSTLLYLQHIDNIESRMSPFEWEKFTKKGFFTIRLTDKFWSGLWTDLTIEQKLMRAVKTSGGLTGHGRGLGPGTIARFLKTAPVLSPYVEALEDFCGVRAESTEQHKELRDSRMKRDRLDLEKYLAWLSIHSPFDDRPEDVLVSLATGLIGDSTVNCDLALERGADNMQSAAGVIYGNLHVRRSARVTTLASMSQTINAAGKGAAVQVNPNQLFHRIICALKKNNNLEMLPKCFEFELSARPTALFEDTFMRTGTKSTFVSALEKYALPSSTIPADATFVMDGGFFLHKLTWPSPATFGQVCSVYKSYLGSFGQSCEVVFDGYSKGPSTKDEAHMRRCNRVTSADVAVREEVFVSVARDRFLNNEQNKSALIELLAAHLQHSGTRVQRAPADADVLIVQTAIARAEAGATAVVIGEDTDLLVLLIALMPKGLKCHLFMPGRSGKPGKVYDIAKLQDSLQDLGDLLLFFYAMTGCDTTSALHMRGKIKTWNKFKNTSQAKKLQYSKFNSPTQTQETIARIGEEFILEMYGASTEVSLDKLRFTNYTASVERQSASATFQLSHLPPTSAAARMHSYRAYLQVQQWRGNALPPTEWGWALHEGRLRPVPTDKAPAPLELLHMVFCNCPSECAEHCDCRRSGLPCSALCGFCGGSSCENSPDVDDDEDADDPTP